MTILSPDQRRAIGEAGDEPVPVTDPETQQTYLIIKTEVYDAYVHSWRTKRSIPPSLKSMILSRLMTILDKLPISEQPTVLLVGTKLDGRRRLVSLKTSGWF